MSADPVEAWIRKAEGNFISATTLVRRRNILLPDVVCNQCHQCAEKYLKAILVRHRTAFPKTHDLTQLEDLVAGVDPDVRLVHTHLAVLDPYGIDIRYPGIDATLEDAREAVVAMKAVRKFVRAKLGLKSK
jgi:HEPN domain-containing protein